MIGKQSILDYANHIKNSFSAFGSIISPVLEKISVLVHHKPISDVPGILVKNMERAGGE